MRALWTTSTYIVFGVLAGCTEVVLPIQASDELGISGAAGASLGGAPGAGSGGVPALGGMSGTPGVGGTASVECPVALFEREGWVQGRDRCPVQGAWFAYNDCYDSPADCTVDHLPSREQFLAEPVPGGRTYRPCTSGTTAVPGDEQERALKWGAGIELSLNQEANATMKIIHPVGQWPMRLVGFRIALAGDQVPSEVRINFPTASTRAREHFVRYTPQTSTVLFADAAQFWLPEEQRVPLDAEAVESIQIFVPTQVGQAVSFDFCVTELTALFEPR